MKLSKFTEENGIALQVIRQYGFLGYLRNYTKELTVTESKPAEIVVDDLRLTSPFPALKVNSFFKHFQEYALSINLESLDSMEHKHVPFVAILL